MNLNIVSCLQQIKLKDSALALCRILGLTEIRSRNIQIAFHSRYELRLAQRAPLTFSWLVLAISVKTHSFMVATFPLFPHKFKLDQFYSLVLTKFIIDFLINSLKAIRIKWHIILCVCTLNCTF